MAQRRAKDDVVRITTAPTAPHDDLDGRRRRYVMAMMLRTACFIGAYAVGPGWLRWVLVAGAVFLPYFAVVAANVTSQKSDDFNLRPLDVHVLEAGTGTTELGRGRAGEW